MIYNTKNAIDDVINGSSIIETIDRLVESNSPVKLTKGLKNAYSKIDPFKSKCPSENCNFVMPVYKGKYPSKCPLCGTKMDV